MRDVNLNKHKQLLEEKAKREREELRRQLFVGVDYIGQGDDIKIFIAEQRGPLAVAW